MNSKGSSTGFVKRVELKAPKGRNASGASSHNNPPGSHAPSGPAHAATAKKEPKRKAEADFVFYSSPLLTLICLPEAPAAAFSLTSAAQQAGVHPEILLYYCRLGLLGPERAQSGALATFDNAALEEVARVEHYRRNLGVQRQALPFVCEMRREGVRLEIELRFLEAAGGGRLPPVASWKRPSK
jgi:hypothetical protein